MFPKVALSSRGGGGGGGGSGGSGEQNDALPDRGPHGAESERASGRRGQSAQLAHALKRGKISRGSIAKSP